VKVTAWHEAGGAEYHHFSECHRGSRVKHRNRVTGTSGLPRCGECAGIDRKPPVAVRDRRTVLRR
jgi:hypothetical protein